MCSNTAFTSEGQFGNDCNDTSYSIKPSANDVCGNGVDENCSGSDSICGSTAGNCQKILSNYTIPQGFGSPFNVVVDPGQELTNINCQTNNTVDLNIGIGSVHEYIFNTAYIRRNNIWMTILFRCLRPFRSPGVYAWGRKAHALSSARFRPLPGVGSGQKRVSRRQIPRRKRLGYEKLQGKIHPPGTPEKNNSGTHRRSAKNDVLSGPDRE